MACSPFAERPPKVWAESVRWRVSPPRHQPWEAALSLESSSLGHVETGSLGHGMGTRLSPERAVGGRPKREAEEHPRLEQVPPMRLSPQGLRREALLPARCHLSDAHPTLNEGSQY